SWAGSSAALAALTRILCVLLVVPLVVEALLQSREDRRAAMSAPPPHPRARRGAASGERRIPVRALAWSMAPIPASGIYLWFWHHVSGDWFAPIHQQANWQRTLSNPVSTLVKGTHEGLRWIGFYPGGYHLLDWLITVPVLVAGVYALVRFRATYGVYVWVSLLAPLSFIFQSRPLMSVPRFVLPLFPVYWSAARWTEGSRGRHELVLVASAMLLGVLLLLFVNWYYVF